MNIYVTTSNNYVELAIPFSILFNKYWPGNEITFLGFEERPSEQLPDNCKFISLGNQSDFGDSWTDPLRPFFENINDSHFVVTTEDAMLVGPVDQSKASLLESEIIEGNAKKAMLDSHLNPHASFEPYKDGIKQLSQTAEYRTSLHPAIWNKDYFLNFLKPNYTAWDFEIKNFQESMTDGERVICLDQDEFLYKISNVYNRGRPFPRPGDKLPYGSTGGILKEDILLVYNYLPKNVREANLETLKSTLVEGVRYH